jgi:hypothetical protein
MYCTELVAVYKGVSCLQVCRYKSVVKPEDSLFYIGGPHEIFLDTFLVPSKLNAAFAVEALSD